MSDVPPLDRISDALRDLGTAASNVRYYGLDHPYVAEYIRAAQGAIAALLESAPSLTLLVVAGKLVVDGRAYANPPTHALRFVEMLTERGMESLTFQRGVTPEDVTTLVARLAGKGGEGLPLSPALRVGHVELRGDGGEASAAAGESGAAPAGAAGGFEPLGEIDVEIIQGLYEMAEKRQPLDSATLDRIVWKFMFALLADLNPVGLLATAQGAKEYIFTHAVNVGILTIVQAKSLGFAGQMLHEIGVASMLHDIGKLFLPSEILDKPGALTPDERAAVEKHTLKGARYLLGQPHIPEIAVVAALEHHRKFDGTGYPVSKPGWRPSLIGQMVAISDVFDALRADRIYRDAKPKDEILRIMAAGRGVEFHPRLLDNFVGLIGRPAAPPSQGEAGPSTGFIS